MKPTACIAWTCLLGDATFAAAQSAMDAGRAPNFAALVRAAMAAHAAAHGAPLPATDLREKRAADPHARQDSVVHVPVAWVPALDLLRGPVPRSHFARMALAAYLGVVEPAWTKRTGDPIWSARYRRRKERAAARALVPVAARASHGALAAFLARRDAETGCRA